ncbi:hypothetical protein [Candidatus Thiodiazotropha sp. CDECU1]|uniref:hypothetical protein n=1 Tax=Candidatus Thiodiazotropha sp. CDECU1 TaxID=3065865 RepID=UPI00292E330D|nr:hypothetical protein [Candidatus Thiodiazotropha sp. CDECU1]
MEFTYWGSRKYQLGGATVETILVATVLVPVLGSLPLLGKIADINNTTNQTSRYMAWEQTVTGTSGKPVSQLQAEVSNRFFARPDLQIRTNRPALSEEEQTNHFWTGYGVTEEDEVNRLVSYGDGLTLDLDNESPDSLAGTLSSGIATIGRTMARFTGGEWHIEEAGLYTARVSVDVASNQYLASGNDCDNHESEEVTACVSRSNTIFVDAWEVADANHAEERTRTFVPAAGLEELGSAAVEIVGMVPFFADLGTLETDENGGFGYIDSEVLPLDRYAED